MKKNANGGMKRMARALAACVMLLVFQQAASAENSAQQPTTAKKLAFDDILTMLDSSEKQYSYLGTKFVIDYTPTRRSTTLVKVTYGAPGWEKKEVSPLQSGESQIILDDGKFLWHYIPSKASVIKKKQQFSLGKISRRIYSQSTLIEQNYEILIEQQNQAEPSALVAQVPSVMGDVMVSFLPKMRDRPSWKIWIESAHGLIVRTEVYDANGELAVLSAFSELTFQLQLSEKSFVVTVPKGTKMETAEEKHFQTLEEARQQVRFPISVPQYMPAGFVLSSIISSPTARGEKVHLAYIDGMSSISIFEEQHAAEVETSQEASKEVEINPAIKGTFHDHGLIKILRWAIDEERIMTLVGEVADAELLKIAASITN